MKKTQFTNGGMMAMLERSARSYVKTGIASVKQNKHMNNITPSDKVEQRVLEGIVVDFCNHIISERGGDFGLRTSDICSTNKRSKK
jgi:coproporphyrinogen III oxidase